MNPVRAVLLAALLAFGLLAAPASARAQDPVAECLSGGGIYLYVHDQSAEVLAGCSHAETALARLLELTTVQTIGQGFICQIDGRPERCVNTPGGTDPYWSFWWWRDGQWQYANIGASYRGTPGSIEAWHYSPGEPPPVLPAADASPLPGYEISASFTPAASAPATAPPDEQVGDQDWVPTAATLGVLLLAGSGYWLWRRKRA